MSFPTARGGVTMDTFYSLTLDHLHKNGMVEDNVFDAVPLFKWLKAKGRVVPFTGGAKIEVKIIKGTNGTVGSVGEYEEIDLSPSDPITTVYYNTAEYAGACTFSNKELSANRGREKVVDQVATEAKVTALTFGEEMSKHLWDVANITVASSLTGNGGKNIIGLPILAPYNVAATATNLAGLDPYTNTAEAFWANQTQDYGSANSAVGMANSINSLYIKCSVYGPGGPPDGGFCDLTTWSKIVAAMDAQKRYMTSDEKLSSLGIQNINYLQCAISADPYACDPEAGLNYDGSPTAGVLYMLHSEFTKLYQRTDRDFKPGPMRPAPKQLAKSSIFEWEGQLVTSNRRKNGVLYGITKAPYA